MRDDIMKIMDDCGHTQSEAVYKLLHYFESEVAESRKENVTEIHNKIMVQWEKDFGSIHNEQTIGAYAISGFVRAALKVDSGELVSTEKEWISVNEKWPEGEVMLLTSSRMIILGDWYKGEWRTHRSRWIEIDGANVFKSAYKKEEITHWSPLPDTSKLK